MDTDRILEQAAPGTDGKLLLAFDFDLTIVGSSNGICRSEASDADTDRWGPEVLAPRLRLRMEELAPTWQWTDLVSVTAC